MNKFAVMFSGTNGDPQTVSREKLAIYAENLQDLDAESLSLACASAAKSCKFFPTVAHIREHAEKRAGHDAPNLAWDKIVKKIEGWRYALENEADAVYSGFSCARGMATFDVGDLDAAARLALTRLGGPRSLACANPSHIPLLKKQFVEEYSSVRIEHPHLLDSAFPEVVKQLAEKLKMPM